MRLIVVFSIVVFCLGCGPTPLVVSTAPGPVAKQALKSNSTLFPARDHDKTGFIDVNGNMVIPAQWDSASAFHDGLAAVANYVGPGSESETGYIDRAGKMVIPMQRWDNIVDHDFHDGVVAYAKGDRYGFMDSKGKIVIEPRFYYEPSAPGADACEDEEGPVQDFSEGFAFVQEGHRHYFIDKTGKRAFGRDFDDAQPFHDGIAAANNGKGWGFIDKKGNWLIKPKYGSVGNFFEGVAPVEKSNHVWVFIDRTGKQAISGEFAYAESFSEGKAVVYKPDASETTTGLMDRSGKTLWLQQGWTVHSLHDGAARVEIDTPHEETTTYAGGSTTSSWSDNQTIFVDKDGKELVRLIPIDLKKRFFGQAAKDFENGLLHVWSQEPHVRQGYVDRSGHWIWVEPGTDEIEPAAKPR